MTFGERIRQLRNERRWSMRKLAELSGVNVQTIHRIEHGAGFHGATLFIFAAAFGLSPAELFEDVNDEVVKR